MARYVFGVLISDLRCSSPKTVLQVTLFESFVIKSSKRSKMIFVAAGYEDSDSVAESCKGGVGSQLVAVQELARRSFDKGFVGELFQKPPLN